MTTLAPCQNLRPQRGLRRHPCRTRWQKCIVFLILRLNNTTVTSPNYSRCWRLLAACPGLAGYESRLNRVKQAKLTVGNTRRLILCPILWVSASVGLFSPVFASGKFAGHPDLFLLGLLKPVNPPCLQQLRRLRDKLADFSGCNRMLCGLIYLPSTHRSTLRRPLPIAPQAHCLCQYWWPIPSPPPWYPQ